MADISNVNQGEIKDLFESLETLACRFRDLVKILRITAH
jgi:hypothetical protein